MNKTDRGNFTYTGIDKCPNCGNEHFEIEDHEYNEKELEVQFECPECDTKFSDWYDIKFTHREITDDPQNIMKHKEAREQILDFQELETEHSIQKLLHENHTESNCQCDGEETATMRSEGAGDMEICLDCFGAKGCVY